MPNDKYIRLLNAIDMMIDMFEQVKKETPEMFLWSITVTAGIGDTKIVWQELIGKDYRKHLCDIAGKTGDDNKVPFEVTTYAVTGKGVTVQDWDKVRDVCICAAKSLHICSRRQEKVGISEYLDTFVEVGIYLQKEEIVASEVGYCVPSWFEFIFNASNEIGCPIVAHCGPITLPSFKDIPYRFIQNNLCEASILALKFLRNAAEKQAEPEQKDEGSKIMMTARTSKENWEAIRSEYDISKKDFGKKINFVSDSFKRKIIFRDIEHAFVLASQGFSKPALILAGGVIEELLRQYLKHKNIKPKNKQFVYYIKACEDNGLLKRRVLRLGDLIRDFRNLVHLDNEKTIRHTVSKATAKGAVSSIFTIANDFQ